MNRTSIHTNPARRLTAGLLWLWLAAAALCCAACVRDDIDGGGGFTNDDDAAAFMVCQIAPTTSGVFTRGGASGSGVSDGVSGVSGGVSGPETRADDEFDNGDETEYALAPGNYHFVLLYRKNENTPAGVVSLQSPDAIADRPETGVTQTLVAVFGIKQEQVDDFKTFLNSFEALALLNFDPYQLDLVTEEAEGWVTKTPEEIMASPLAQKSELMGRTVKEGSIEVNGTKYYTMTSSVYLNGSSTIYGCEKKSEELYDSKQRAIAAALRGEANIVTYVERIVAKVVPMFNVDQNGYLERNVSDTNKPLYSKVLFYQGLSSDNADGDDRYDVHTVERDWRARLVGYGLNGLEQETNLFKDFKNTTYWTGNNKLNDLPHHRSYWAEDTHYTVDNTTVTHYPHQYRTALENDTIRDYHRVDRAAYPRLIDQWSYDGTNWVPDWEDHPERFTVHLKEPGENNSYYLKYIPFSTLRDGGNDRTWSNNNLNATNSTAKPEAFYLLENTYDDRNNMLSDRGYFTAGTHLLVACQLEIADQSGTYRTYDHIYKDQNDIFYAGNHIVVGADNTDEGMRELLMSKFDLLANKALLGGNVGLNILHVNWLNHNPVEEYTKPLEWPIGSKLYIERHRQDAPDVWSEWMDEADSWLDLTLIPAELTGGDGQLLIAPRWYNNRFAIGILGDPDNFTVLTYDEIVSLFHKLVGPIDHYKNGYMYYAAPVGHNTSNTNWVSKEVGSVGVVRNHAYTINVNSISAPGRSVDMVGQPIIPLLDVKRDYIDVSVKILDWHGIWQDNIPMRPTQ